MDIIPQNVVEIIGQFKNDKLLFSPLENSTCTVEGQLVNVQHNEDEIIDILSCSNKIIAIDCNFGHLTYKESKEPVVKKSNRGRKKKPKVVKNRKFQGDGTEFNSQISFKIIGNVIRKAPFIQDNHSKNAETFTKDNEKYEKFINYYKIKVFRNGKITVPGVLMDDFSDLEEPLQILCEYLSKVFLEDVHPENLRAIMRNYKFRLLNGMIDLHNLHKYCSTHFQNLLNINFHDILEFISNPIFKDSEIDPYHLGWNEFISEENQNKIEYKISTKKIIQHLKDTESNKNIFIDAGEFTDKLMDLPIKECYLKIIEFVKIIQEFNIFIHNDVIKKIIIYLIIDKIFIFQKSLVKSKHNLLSYIKYDSEKYPGYLIKVKTPNLYKPNKKTTIKIFPSGKIDIDGANEKIEAQYIYYWLNNLFLKNPEFIYKNDIQRLLENTDSEFSSDSDDDFPEII